MSVIIRLQNLPWSANSLDIRQFFKGLLIPDGGVHIVGGEHGDAFIAFSSDEDARVAMMKTGGLLHGAAVKLLLSSRSEMQRVIDTARQVALAAAAQQQQQQAVALAIEKPVIVPPSATPVIQPVIQPPAPVPAVPVVSQPALASSMNNNSTSSRHSTNDLEIIEVKQADKEDVYRSRRSPVGTSSSSRRRSTRSRSRSLPTRDGRRPERRPDRRRGHRSRSRDRRGERSSRRDRRSRSRDHSDQGARGSRRRRNNSSNGNWSRRGSPPPPPSSSSRHHASDQPRRRSQDGQDQARIRAHLQQLAGGSGGGNAATAPVRSGLLGDRPAPDGHHVYTPVANAPAADTITDSVRLTRLPTAINYRDVREFMRGLHIRAIKLVKDEARRVICAAVQMTSVSETAAAVLRSGRVMHSHAVHVQPITSAEFEDVVDNYQRPAAGSGGDSVNGALHAAPLTSTTTDAPADAGLSFLQQQQKMPGEQQEQYDVEAASAAVFDAAAECVVDELDPSAGMAASYCGHDYESPYYQAASSGAGLPPLSLPHQHAGGAMCNGNSAVFYDEDAEAAGMEAAAWRGMRPAVAPLPFPGRGMRLPGGAIRARLDGPVNGFGRGGVRGPPPFSARGFMRGPRPAGGPPRGSWPPVRGGGPLNVAFARVGNVPYQVRPESLHELLAPFPYQEFIIEHEPGQPHRRTGIAYVVFNSVDVATAAIERLSGCLLGQRPVELRLCPQRVYGECARLQHQPPYKAAFFGPPSASMPPPPPASSSAQQQTAPSSSSDNQSSVAAAAASSCSEVLQLTGVLSSVSEAAVVELVLTATCGRLQPRRVHIAAAAPATTANAENTGAEGQVLVYCEFASEADVQHAASMCDGAQMSDGAVVAASVVPARVMFSSLHASSGAVMDAGQTAAATAAAGGQSGNAKDGDATTGTGGGGVQEVIDTGALLDSFGRPGSVVAISNLSTTASTEHLLHALAKYRLGPDQVIRRYDADGRPTGDARVAFDCAADAQHAVADMTGVNVLGQQIFLNVI